MKQCPCGSFLPEEMCCLPIVMRQKKAPTALALMRSRYSAYVWGKAEYIFDSYAEEWRGKQNRQKWLDSFQQIDWEGLEIISVFQGSAKDETGEVEFLAHYRMNGHSLSLQERSLFQREAGSWVYVGEKEGN